MTVDISTVETKEIDDLMKKYRTSSEQTLPAPDGTTPQKEIKAGVLTEMLVSSLTGVSKILARKTTVKAWELDEHDQKDLKSALAPFESELYKLLQYIKYLPLAIFAIGYTFRVIDGMKDKKKMDRDRIEKEKRDKLKAAEEEKKLLEKKESETTAKPN